MSFHLHQSLIPRGWPPFLFQPLGIGTDGCHPPLPVCAAPVRSHHPLWCWEWRPRWCCIFPLLSSSLYHLPSALAYSLCAGSKWVSKWYLAAHAQTSWGETMFFVIEWTSKKTFVPLLVWNPGVSLQESKLWAKTGRCYCFLRIQCVNSETLLSVRLWLPENLSCSESNDCFWKSHLICLPESGKVSFPVTLKVPVRLLWVMITHSLLKLYLIAAQRHYLIFKSTYLIFFLSCFINNIVF